jgi:probable rRNA maturation factor
MPELSVSVTDGHGRPVGRSGLRRWLVRAAPAAARGTVALALVSDRTIRRLNRRYRGIDRVTDVLSFPASPGPEGPGLHLQVDGAPRLQARGMRSPRALGDIAIAIGVARRQARALGHPVETELRVLALHGLLHLLGYDHDADRGEMRRVEERLRRRAGLPPGLIARDAYVLGRAGGKRANERTRVSPRPSTGSGRREPVERRERSGDRS